MHDVLKDITPFDLMMSGLSKVEVRNNLINQYNGLRIEMDMSSAKFKPETFKQMEELFNRIKVLSTNIPKEIKTWKLGGKIILKNKGKPTAEEGIKDAMNVASKIFQARPSPKYIKYENIRAKTLQTLENKKPDGQGWLISDAWGALKDTFSSKTKYKLPTAPTQPSLIETKNLLGTTIKYKAPKERTFTRKGVNMTETELDEIVPIVASEISNNLKTKTIEVEVIASNDIIKK